MNKVERYFDNIAENGINNCNLTPLERIAKSKQLVSQARGYVRESWISDFLYETLETIQEELRCAEATQ